MRLLSMPPGAGGYGAEGTRTPGLISAIDALSQLSYSPSPTESEYTPDAVYVKTRPIPGQALLRPATAHAHTDGDP